MSSEFETNVKAAAHQLIDDLPDDAMWDDLMDAIYVRMNVEEGIRDADAGRTLSTDELRRRLGLQ